MNAKRVLQITVALLLTVIIGFCTWWTAVNAKALGAFFKGEKVTYNSVLAKEREQHKLIVDEYLEKVNGLGDLVSDVENKLSEALASGETKGMVIESLNAQVLALQVNAQTLSSQISEWIVLNANLAGDNQSLSYSLSQVQRQLLDYISMISHLRNLVVYLSDTLIDWDNRIEYLVSFYVGVDVWDFQVLNGSSSKIIEPPVPQGDFVFVGWSLDGKTIVNLAQVVVASDIVFYAVVSTGFTNDSWEIIDVVCSSGLAPLIYSEGDEKDFVFQVGYVTTVVILGFNHDDYADGSGKAAITVGMKNLLPGKIRMSGANNNLMNSGSDTKVEMFTTTLPKYYSQFPQELKNIIKPVKKLTANGGSEGTKLIEIVGELFLFSEVELRGTSLTSRAGEGEQYEYWKTIKDGAVDANCIKYLNNGLGAATNWWLRSPAISNTTSFCRVSASGSTVLNDTATKENGVSFGFCIGTSQAA